MKPVPGKPGCIRAPAPDRRSTMRPRPSPSVQPRWVWFGVGVAAASIALIALVEHLVASRRHGLPASTAAAIAMTVAAFGVAVALIVTMALDGLDYRWTAFGVGGGMVGVGMADNPPTARM